MFQEMAARRRAPPRPRSAMSAGSSRPTTAGSAAPDRLPPAKPLSARGSGRPKDRKEEEALSEAGTRPGSAVPGRQSPGLSSDAGSSYWPGIDEEPGQPRPPQQQRPQSSLGFRRPLSGSGVPGPLSARPASAAAAAATVSEVISHEAAERGLPLGRLRPMSSRGPRGSGVSFAAPDDNASVLDCLSEAAVEEDTPLHAPGAAAADTADGDKAAAEVKAKRERVVTFDEPIDYLQGSPSAAAKLLRQRARSYVRTSLRRAEKIDYSTVGLEADLWSQAIFEKNVPGSPRLVPSTAVHDVAVAPLLSPRVSKLPADIPTRQPIHDPYGVSAELMSGKSAAKLRKLMAKAEESGSATNGIPKHVMTVLGFYQPNAELEEAEYKGLMGGLSASWCADAQYDDLLASELATIKTGMDAITFFAKHGDQTDVKVLYCKRDESNKEGKGNVYRPYDLVIVSEEARGGEFFMISSKGVVQCRPGMQSEHTPIDEWIHEVLLFSMLLCMSFFRNYLANKAMSHWRKGARKSAYGTLRQRLVRHSFFAKPGYVQHLVRIHAHLQLAAKDTKLFALQLEPGGRALELPQFQKQQKDMKTFAELDNRVGDVRQVTDDVLAAVIAAGHAAQEADQLQHLSHKKSEDQPRFVYQQRIEAAESAFRKRLREYNRSRFGPFVRLVDVMLQGTLVAMVVDRSLEVLERVKKTPKLFSVSVSFAGQGVIEYTPAEKDFQESFDELMTQAIQLVNAILPLSSTTQYKNYMGDAYGASVGEVLKSDRTFLRTRSEIAQRIEQDFSKAKKFAEQHYAPYNNIYEFGSKWNKAEFERTLPSAKDLVQGMTRMLEYEGDLERLKAVHMFGFIQLQARTLRSALMPPVEEGLASKKTMYRRAAAESCRHVTALVEHSIRQLQARPQKLQDFCEFVKALRGIEVQKEDTEEARASVDEMYTSCRQYSIRVDVEEEMRREQLNLKFGAFASQSMPAAQQFVSSNLATWVDDVRRRMNSMEVEAAHIRRRLSDGLFVAPSEFSQALGILEKLDDVEFLLDEMRRNGFFLNSCLDVLGQAKLELPSFEAALWTLRQRAEIWEIALQWNQEVSKWRSKDFLLESLEVDWVQRRIASYDAALWKMESEKALAGDPVLAEARRQLELWTAAVPVLMNLRSPALKARHWQRLGDVLKVRTPHDQLTLQELWSTDLFAGTPLGARLRQVLGEVASQAVLEEDLEKTLRHIEQSWHLRELVVLRSGGEGPKAQDPSSLHAGLLEHLPAGSDLLGDHSDIMDTLEADLATLQASVSLALHWASGAAAPPPGEDKLSALHELQTQAFEMAASKLRDLTDRLQRLQDMLLRWFDAQEMYLKLNKWLVGAEDLPHEGDDCDIVDCALACLEEVSSMWFAMFDALRHSQDRKLLALVSQRQGQSLQQQLDSAISYIESGQNSMRLLLHIRRQRCVRLNFVGDNDLLDMMSHCSSPSTIVSRLVPLLFRNIASIYLRQSERDHTKSFKSQGSGLTGEASVTFDLSPKEASNWSACVVSLEGERLVCELPESRDEGVPELLKAIELCVKRRLMSATHGAVRALASLDDGTRRAQLLEDWAAGRSSGLTAQGEPVQALFLAMAVQHLVDLATVCDQAATSDVKQVEISFQADMESLAKARHQILEEFTKMLRTRKLPTALRLSTSAAILQTLDEQRVVAAFAAEELGRKDSFVWQRQLRYELQDWYDPLDGGPPRGSVAVQMFDWQSAYGFEYVGVAPRLVLTPETDRSLLGLVATLRQTTGQAAAMAVSGPCGSGRTSLIKDLAGRVAVPLFDCPAAEQQGTEAIYRLTRGVLSAGCWFVFSNSDLSAATSAVAFHHHAAVTLAALAECLRALSAARSASGSLIALDGHNVQVAAAPSSPAITIVLRDFPAGGSSARAFSLGQRWPTALTCLLRPLLAVQPSRQQVMEALLMAEGYEAENAKLCAHKAAKCFSLLLDHMASDHFPASCARSMRSLIRVVRDAGARFRASLEEGHRLEHHHQKALEVEHSQLAMGMALFQVLGGKEVRPESDTGLLKNLLATLFPLWAARRTGTELAKEDASPAAGVAAPPEQAAASPEQPAADRKCSVSQRRRSSLALRKGALEGKKAAKLSEQAIWKALKAISLGMYTNHEPEKEPALEDEVVNIWARDISAATSCATEGEAAASQAPAPKQEDMPPSTLVLSRKAMDVYGHASEGRAVVLTGGACSGKSTLLRVIDEAIGAKAGLPKNEREMRFIRLYPDAMSRDEFFGDALYSANGWRGGSAVLPNLLQQLSAPMPKMPLDSQRSWPDDRAHCSERERVRHMVIFDAEVDGAGWTDALAGLFDRSCGLSGKCGPVAPGVVFAFESRQLASASPSFCARTAICTLDDVLTLQDSIRSFEARLLQHLGALSPVHVARVSNWAKLLLHKTDNILHRIGLEPPRCCGLGSGLTLLHAERFFAVLQALLDEKSGLRAHAGSSHDPKVEQELLEMSAVYAALWGIGGNVEARHRTEFAELLLQVLGFEPSGQEFRSEPGSKATSPAASAAALAEKPPAQEEDAAFDLLTTEDGDADCPMSEATDTSPVQRPAGDADTTPATSTVGAFRGSFVHSVLPHAAALLSELLRAPEDLWQLQLGVVNGQLSCRLGTEQLASPQPAASLDAFDEGGDKAALFVPTIETVCLRSFCDLLRASQRGFLLYGGAQEGKSAAACHLLRFSCRFQAGTGMLLRPAVNADSAILASALDSQLRQTSKLAATLPRTKASVLGARCCVLIDDVHMAASTMPEFLRQLVENRSYYSTQRTCNGLRKTKLQAVQGLVLSAAMAAERCVQASPFPANSLASKQGALGAEALLGPHAARWSRWLRHLQPVRLQPLSVVSMERLCTQLLANWTAQQPLDVREFFGTVVSSVWNLCVELKKKLKPAEPNRPAPRCQVIDVVQWCVGMSRVAKVETPAQLTTLAWHEAARQFGDRLEDDAERRGVAESLTCAGLKLPKSSAEPLFAPLQLEEGEDGEKVKGELRYQALDDPSKAKEVLTSTLEQHLDEEGTMPLVLFHDLVKSLIALSRALGLVSPGHLGGALVLGPAGCGKRSCAYLASKLARARIQHPLFRGEEHDDMDEIIERCEAEHGVLTESLLELMKQDPVGGAAAAAKRPATVSTTELAHAPWTCGSADYLKDRLTVFGPVQQSWFESSLSDDGECDFLADLDALLRQAGVAHAPEEAFDTLADKSGLQSEKVFNLPRRRRSSGGGAVPQRRSTAGGTHAKDPKSAFAYLNTRVEPFAQKDDGRKRVTEDRMLRRVPAHLKLAVVLCLSPERESKCFRKCLVRYPGLLSKLSLIWVKPWTQQTAVEVAEAILLPLRGDEDDDNGILRVAKEKFAALDLPGKLAGIAGRLPFGCPALDAHKRRQHFPAVFVASVVLLKERLKEAKRVRRQERDRLQIASDRFEVIVSIIAGSSRSAKKTGGALDDMRAKRRLIKELTSTIAHLDNQVVDARELVVNLRGPYMHQVGADYRRYEKAKDRVLALHGRTIDALATPELSSKLQQVLRCVTLVLGKSGTDLHEFLRSHPLKLIKVWDVKALADDDLALMNAQEVTNRVAYGVWPPQGASLQEINVGQALAAWTRAAVAFAQVVKRILPEAEKLAEAEKELEDMEARQEECRKEREQAKEDVKKLEVQLGEHAAEVQGMATALALKNKYGEKSHMAEVLPLHAALDALEENVSSAWKVTIESLSEESDGSRNLPGNLLLGAFWAHFAGALDVKSRASLRTHWLGICRSFGIRIDRRASSSDYVRLLQDLGTVGETHSSSKTDGSDSSAYAKLVSHAGQAAAALGDSVSVAIRGAAYQTPLRESTTLAFRGKLRPLLLDPVGLAKSWLLQRFKVEQSMKSDVFQDPVFISQFCSTSDLMQKLETAVEEALPAVLELGEGGPLPAVVDLLLRGLLKEVPSEHLDLYLICSAREPPKFARHPRIFVINCDPTANACTEEWFLEELLTLDGSDVAEQLEQSRVELADACLERSVQERKLIDWLVVEDENAMGKSGIQGDFEELSGLCTELVDAVEQEDATMESLDAVYERAQVWRTASAIAKTLYNVSCYAHFWSGAYDFSGQRFLRWFRQLLVDSRGAPSAPRACADEQCKPFALRAKMSFVKTMVLELFPQHRLGFICAVVIAMAEWEGRFNWNHFADLVNLEEDEEACRRRGEMETIPVPDWIKPGAWYRLCDLVERRPALLSVLDTAQRRPEAWKSWACRATASLTSNSEARELPELRWLLAAGCRDVAHAGPLQPVDELLVILAVAPQLAMPAFRRFCAAELGGTAAATAVVNDDQLSPSQSLKLAVEDAAQTKALVVLTDACATGGEYAAADLHASLAEIAASAGCGFEVISCLRKEEVKRARMFFTEEHAANPRWVLLTDVAASRRLQNASTQKQVWDMIEEILHRQRLRHAENQNRLSKRQSMASRGGAMTASDMRKALRMPLLLLSVQLEDAQAGRGSIESYMHYSFFTLASRVAIAPPVGVRGRLAAHAQDMIDMSKEARTGQEVSIVSQSALALHSLLLERLRFSPVGWASDVTWNKSDLACIYDMLLSAPEGCHLRDELLQVAAAVVYGGRFGGSQDMETLSTLVATRFGARGFATMWEGLAACGKEELGVPRQLEEIQRFLCRTMPEDDALAGRAYSLSAAGLIGAVPTCPDNCEVGQASLDLMHSCDSDVKNLLGVLQSTVQTLAATEHSNSRLNLGAFSCSMAIDTWRRHFSPGTTDVESTDPDTTLLRLLEVLADEFEQAGPACWEELHEDSHQQKSEDKLLKALAAREVERLSRWQAAVAESIARCCAVTRGQMEATPEDEEVCEALTKQKVPDFWGAFCGGLLDCGGRSISSWRQEVQARSVDLRALFAGAIIPSYWIGGFFSPGDFLTTVLRKGCRRLDLNLEEAGLAAKATEYDAPEVLWTVLAHDSLDRGPAGSTYVHGVVLQGAMWSSFRQSTGSWRMGHICEIPGKAEDAQLPILAVVPVLTAPSQKTLRAVDDSPCQTRREHCMMPSEWTSYRCPLYRRSWRGARALAYLELPSSVPASTWAIRGVALVCESS
eukprot:TRINITY_DN44989_c0_g1_i1.p1 TRINITY_DN44989_c0_g1~~TRINITY_DN44989_c0_g1_i1.p1  ORF type:complete len:5060 (+),score=1321.98 TRINITY_DN44989_c0_g1_i1:129-15308(+)